MHSSAPVKNGSRLLNIGTGVETSVNRLTEAIIAATGFNGAGYGPRGLATCHVPSSTPEPPSTSSAGSPGPAWRMGSQAPSSGSGGRRPALAEEIVLDVPDQVCCPSGAGHHTEATDHGTRDLGRLPHNQVGGGGHPSAIVISVTSRVRP